MDLNSQKEQFSYAYIHAVASAAGYSVQLKTRVMDNAGLDLIIEMPGQIGTTLFPKFEAQVKCTSLQKVYNPDCIKFPLPVKNYNVLRHISPYVPTILIIILVPEQLEDWLKVSNAHAQTIIQHCGYWMSLKGYPETQNQATVTIEIPRKNLFTPDSLKQIMQKIGRAEDL